MGFVPQYSDYISQIKLPGYPNQTFYLKDSEARQWIEEIASAGIKFTVAWKGNSIPDVTKIPLGVTVTYLGDNYTGTLIASASTAPYIYLIYSKTINNRKIYEEYITVTEGTGESGDPYTYWWEELGDTDISIDDLGVLAYKDSVTLDKKTDVVLGESTSFTNADSSVTFTGGTSDTFVRSYPGTTSKLATTTITGVSGATSASKAIAGTAVYRGNADVGSQITCAKAASSATDISRITLSSGNNSILETASVINEVLTFGSASVSQGSITGVNGTETFTPAITTTNTITPYTFSDITVPIAASNATTVATGSLSSEATGASVMTGLGTADTATAVTGIGTGTAAAQTITVGTGDKVTVLTNNTDIIVS